MQCESSFPILINYWSKL